ncbi:copper-translocating P-type ATPase [Paenibacillus sp. FSL H7-0326]|uniref:heavy metal translocating P-type ATPase n=1 Tax=Paenibacillus sp. FSL H7-0326 TaxID=1921144 RepID=UPI00096E097B|nr:cation-translocating P-type ATPase [Paenibacillus sp. FSL H7-0326]OMC72362.1 copper-translocating P-type ATPase [Paenibacillus sp. FSL H7-0326]
MNTVQLRNVYIWFLPLAVGLALLVSYIPMLDEVAGFPPAFYAMLLGGGVIAYRALLAVLDTHRLTAGTLVVITMAGCAYLGFYKAAALVALMMLVGELLEEITLYRTRQSFEELLALVPEEASVWRDGSWMRVSTSELAPGDRVLVRPGERIPADGTVTRGKASISEAALTGEPMPQDKAAGSQVYQGTVAEFGSIEMTVAKTGEETTMGRIIASVLDAQETKGPMQRLADRIAGYFTPIILGTAAVTWLFTDDLVRTMTVLVIACPCALVLATPTAVVASVGNVAKRGVLVKGGRAMEALSRVNLVCFDKTGTLTEGKPVLKQIKSFGSMTEAELLCCVEGAERYSEHPIGLAIREYAEERELRIAEEPRDFKQEIGMGVSAVVSGKRVRVGNERLVEQWTGSAADAEAAVQFLAEHQHETALLIIVEEELAGGLIIGDQVRDEADQALAHIRKLGVSRIVLLTGDSEGAAASLQRELKLDDVHTRLLPHDKLAVIRRYQREGYVVAMVGEGINDAPALAAADVGIAMGAAGTDLAIQSSQVALMGDRLEKLPEVMRISRSTMFIVRQNIWIFAVAFNVIGILLAASGWIDPVMGAAIHNVASLFVVMNSARLIRKKAGFSV